MRIDTQVGAERELCPRGGLNHFYGALLLGFPWPVTLTCLVLSPYMVHVRILPCVCAHFSAKMDSSEEAYGQLWEPSLLSALSCC